MNILFVNYGDFSTNSLNHIGPFANALTARGHACVVAVPENPESLEKVPSSTFIPATYQDVLARPNLFPNSQPADVVHAWTPRENVRRFVLTYQAALKSPAKLFVHLEDNEDHLIATYTGRTIEELKNLDEATLDNLVIDALPHPVRYPQFLALADAVTVIVEKLSDFVPQGIPVQVLPPGLHLEAYDQPVDKRQIRSELGLGDDETVITFTGSNTFANQAEMRELYVAVALLNQQGRKTRLIRTGFNHHVFQASLTPELTAHVLDLGFVAKSRLPELLAIADVLVQPGEPGAFNDYRLPSKLPEFLASGRPVILPESNVGLLVKNGLQAFVLEDRGPAALVGSIEKVLALGAHAESVGAAGRLLAQAHFDLRTNSRVLEDLYLKTSYRAQNGREAVRATLISADLRRLGAKVVPEANERIRVLTLTATHVRNLEAKLAQVETELRQVTLRLEAELSSSGTIRGMTEQHVHNLEGMVAHLRADALAQAQRANSLQALVDDRSRQFEDFKQRIFNAEGAVAELRHLLNAAGSQANELRQAFQEKAAALAASENRAALANKRAAETELAARTHVDRANEALDLVKQQLANRDHKIKRMQQSFSWQATSPFRALRRLIFDRKPAPVPVAPPPLLTPPVKVTGVIPPPIIAKVSAEPPPIPGATFQPTYSYNLDHPRSWSTVSNRMLILGWCFENSGAKIHGVRGVLGDQVFEGTYGSKRLDVLASVGGKPQAEYCGVKVDMKTTIGDFDLSIEVKHDDGWHSYFKTKVHVGKPGDVLELSEYEKWCQQNEKLTEDDEKALRQHLEKLPNKPLISVIVPVYNPPEALFIKALDSVLNQAYPYWELCIADDASPEPYVRQILERYAAKDPRIKVTYREKNGHISAATNTALELAAGDWVALFDHDDVLHRLALFEAACEINQHPDAEFIYTDEDKIDGEDRRFDPYFKPDWNPDLLHGQNYTSHLSFFRRERVQKLGGFRLGYEGSQDWDLTLRIVDEIPESAIRHIPKVLYHWRAIPGSTALQISEKSYPVDAARRALIDHFARKEIAAKLETVPGDHWRIVYPLPEPAPFVSLIIPTRNAEALVRQAINSIREKTTYQNYEILLIDNGSDDPASLAYFDSLASLPAPLVRVIKYDRPFNYSAINNFAVEHAKGDFIGLINNDIEVISPGWLEEMLSHAARPGVGAVGAMLYYPINTVQHAGVILGLGGVAGHAFKEFARGDQGQKNRLRLVQNFSAVTGACLLIKKSVYLEVGGLNEKHLAVAFNDVDLCCKLITAGYRNVWTPHAELYHHESATRGIENTPEKKARFQSEIDYMIEKWQPLLNADPAYNPNLTLVGEDFSTAYLPRTHRRWQEVLPS